MGLIFRCLVKFLGVKNLLVKFSSNEPHISDDHFEVNLVGGFFNKAVISSSTLIIGIIEINAGFITLKWDANAGIKTPLAESTIA